MVWPPTTYSSLLGERIAEHGTKCWLVNTGWSGGPFGVGHRMPIKHTRALISAALAGDLDNVPCDQDPVFKVDVPVSCPGVPAEILRPRGTWTNAADFDQQAAKLAAMFVQNFEKFASTASTEVIEAGPRADASHVQP